MGGSVYHSPPQLSTQAWGLDYVEDAGVQTCASCPHSFSVREEPLLLGRSLRFIQLPYLPGLPEPYPRTPGSPPQEASYRVRHEPAVGPRSGNPPVHCPENPRSVPSTMETTFQFCWYQCYGPMPGSSWEARKHAHKHGCMSSSRPNKDNAPSTRSSHREVEHSRTHKQDKKSHRAADLPLPSRTCLPCQPSLDQGNRRFRDSPLLWFQLQSAATNTREVKASAGACELFVLGEPSSPHLLLLSAPRELRFPVQDLPQLIRFIWFCRLQG